MATQPMLERDSTSRTSPSIPERSRVSQLLGPRAKKIGPKLAIGYGIMVLGGMALDIVGLLPLAAFGAGFILYRSIRGLKKQNEELGKRIAALEEMLLAQNEANPERREERPTPEGQQASKRPPAQERSTPERHQAPEGPPAPTPELPLASPVALYRASDKARKEGRRRGFMRSVLAFIADKTLRFRSIKGLENRIYSLHSEAAQTEVEIDEARMEAYAQLEDLGKLHPETGNSSIRLQDALQNYQKDTKNSKASLPEFLLEAHTNPKIAKTYEIPDDVMNRVAQIVQDLDNKVSDPQKRLAAIDRQLDSSYKVLQGKILRKAKLSRAVQGVKGRLHLNVIRRIKETTQYVR